ncbi:glutamine-hydrolyzing GMP synthase [Candidatus Woesearchaeota archaeon]|nr:glutamine-hydrolyzing GMP synthase [Candidatus Woesearchaeota archaeon]
MVNAEQADKIIILDFGGQYCHLLARRVRQIGVYAEILPSDASPEQLSGAKGIILSGGPASVYEDNSPQPHPDLFSLHIPMLGLCYGHQLMAHRMGGMVEKGSVGEYGPAHLNLKRKAGLFHNLNAEETVWMSHRDKVADLPPGFSATAATKDCTIAAMENKQRNFYGLQFHPEVTHTPNGMKILENFVLMVCKCNRSWSMKSYKEQVINDIRLQADGKKVFMLVSGGVDSTVAFTLLDLALGEQRVYGLHIDNGFMRKKESAQVTEAIQALGYHNFHAIDASDYFLKAVARIIDPEEKRKIIGEVFVDLAELELRKLHLDPMEWLLCQGTIYPDTIETGGSKHADKIKTHHNRVGKMQELIDAGKVLEPLALLYKDEVRALGEELGLPKNLVWRHPFPGPGLAIRTLCAEHADWPMDRAQIEDTLNQELAKKGYKGFLLPIKSVGVQGDGRTYRHPFVVMGKLDWDVLEEISLWITNASTAINRVVYLVAPDHLTNISVAPATLTRHRLDLLREADAIVMAKDHKEIWQFPTVLLPVGINHGKESVVLRPVYSTEAMTARFGRLQQKELEAMTKQLLKIKEISAVFYDITNKPPGTIEWE